LRPCGAQLYRFGFVINYAHLLIHPIFGDGSYIAQKLLEKALCSQTQTKEIFESVALPRLQKFLCSSFARKF
jgi:hypothetical protein